MRRTKKSVSPNLDVMEPRVLLSAAAPLVSRQAWSGVVHDVRAIMSTLARTRDTVEASAHLTRLSSRIPSGPQGLAPAWRSDIGVYRPHSARSLLTMQRLILGDLFRYVQGGVEGGRGPVSGSGSVTAPAPGQATGGAPTPLPSLSLDSVRIQNTTGLALLVTVHLDVPQIQKPWITETISAQGSWVVPFNFRSATNAFMTMDVSLADGGQSPPAFTNVSLSQPMNGYQGALFSISLLGPYFNVTSL